MAYLFELFFEVRYLFLFGCQLITELYSGEIKLYLEKEYSAELEAVVSEKTIRDPYQRRRLRQRIRF